MSETLSPDTWVGPFRTPRNAHSEAPGSIHNTSVASKLGFKGGTVAGSVHMDQFVPRLLDLYGQAWFETGGMSLYFTQATVDREDVQAAVETGEDRVRLSMFNRDGAMICQGTASAAPDAASELVGRMAGQEPVEPGRFRILAAIELGAESRGLTVTITPERLAEHLELITETIPDYADGVLPPSLVIGLTHQARGGAVGKATQPHVGLFGALEVQHLAGPLRAGVAYGARTRILKLTESPKTENAWYEVVLDHDGRDVARVVYYLRFLKASSPLWA
jgi:hypothetical protein